MIIFLAEMTKNEEVWNKIFAFIFDIYFFIFDVIWNTQIPLTDIKVGYFLIFWLIVNLSIFAVNGTNTDYNNMGSSISKAYSSAIKSRNKKKKQNNIKSETKDKGKKE